MSWRTKIRYCFYLRRSVCWWQCVWFVFRCSLILCDFLTILECEVWDLKSEASCFGHHAGSYWYWWIHRGNSRGLQFTHNLDFCLSYATMSPNHQCIRGGNFYVKYLVIGLLLSILQNSDLVIKNNQLGFVQWICKCKFVHTICLRF